MDSSDSQLNNYEYDINVDRVDSGLVLAEAPASPPPDTAKKTYFYNYFNETIEQNSPNIPEPNEKEKDLNITEEEEEEEEEKEENINKLLNFDDGFSDESIGEPVDTSDQNYSDIEGINSKKQPRSNKSKRQAGRPPRSSYMHSSPIKADFNSKRHANLLEKALLSVSPSFALLDVPQPTENKDTNAKKSKTKIKLKNLLKGNEQSNQIATLISQVKDDIIDISIGDTKQQTAASSLLNVTAEKYLIDRYKYAVRHIRQGLSVEEACNKYRISKGALLKCLSGGTAPRGKKTRLTESEENEIVEHLINNRDLKYNEAIHLVFDQVERIFQQAKRPNPFHNGKPSMDWWYDFLSRHPQIMASKPEWLKRGKVNDQYIRDVQSGKLRCTKFRRALLSAIQYIRSLSDMTNAVSETSEDTGVNLADEEDLSEALSESPKKQIELKGNTAKKTKRSKKLNPEIVPTIEPTSLNQDYYMDGLDTYLADHEIDEAKLNQMSSNNFLMTNDDEDDGLEYNFEMTNKLNYEKFNFQNKHLMVTDDQEDEDNTEMQRGNFEYDVEEDDEDEEDESHTNITTLHDF